MNNEIENFFCYSKMLYIWGYFKSYLDFFLDIKFVKRVFY